MPSYVCPARERTQRGIRAADKVRALRAHPISPVRTEGPMSRLSAPLLLVGSLPLSSTEEVLAVTADEVGGLVGVLPDGETGYRTNWISWQAYFVHHPNPAIETLQRPEEIDGVPQWSPSGFHNLWNFRVKDGVTRVEYGDLFYAEAAIRSYVAFQDLRDLGRFHLASDFRYRSRQRLGPSAPSSGPTATTTTACATATTRRSPAKSRRSLQPSRPKTSRSSGMSATR